MNLEKIKSSGILEQYVLGLLSPSERQKVDVLAEQHPELKAELKMLQVAMEQYARVHSVAPPKNLKSKIISEIDELDHPIEKDTIRRMSAPQNTPGFYRIFSAVAAVLILGLLGLSYLLYNQQQDSRQQMAKLQEKMERLENSYASLQSSKTQVESKFTTLKDLGTHHVHLRGSNQRPNSLAVIYWNPDHKKGYLNVVDLPQAPSGHQYQMWADVNGKHLDMGLIDSISGNSLLTIPFIENSRGFVITLEKEGGSPHPTVEQLAVKGTIEL